MEVKVTNSETYVRELVAAGFCPVECSIGGVSIVDNLAMDHHGELSCLESVAIRAYRDHYGARALDPRFVIVGNPDADATFAVASLAGLLPHPGVDTDGMPPHMVAAATRDLLPLAETIAKLDTDFVGHDVTVMPMGDVSMAWQAMVAGLPHNSHTGVLGVLLWGALVNQHPARRPIFEASVESERTRRRLAGETPVKNVGGVGLVVGAKVFGFDVWYGRDLSRPKEDPAAWAFPVVVALNEGQGTVTVGCPNATVAEALFGPGGLKNVFTALGDGWGGREAIGGSPRGQKMNEAAAMEAAAKISKVMK